MIMTLCRSKNNLCLMSTGMQTNSSDSGHPKNLDVAGVKLVALSELLHFCLSLSLPALAKTNSHVTLEHSASCVDQFSFQNLYERNDHLLVSAVTTE